MKNMIIYGDSIVKGISMIQGKHHVNQLRFTNILEKELGIPIVNKGQMGSTVTRLERMIAHTDTMLQDPEYDTVFILFGGNDCDYDWQAISEDPMGDHRCKTEPQLFFSEYVERVKQLKAMGKQVSLFSLPPIDAEKYFRVVSQNRDEDAIMQWLHGDRSFMEHWQQSYNLLVYKIGATTGAPVLDITSGFLTRRNFTELICDDGIHPNTEGYRLIADQILAQI